MPETRNIVVLGASYAGLAISHYILKHVLPKLPSNSDILYKVLVIDPSTKFFARQASPRGVASGELMPSEKMFLDIEPGFKQYGNNAEFVNGKAVSWNPETQTVIVQKANGEEDVLSYHALILATGTKTNSPLFSLQGTSYLDTLAAIDANRTQLKSAKDIVIAGGGPAGVETAGEIGELLNGTAGWFSSEPSHPRANITIVTNSEKLLPVLRPAVAQQAESYLNRVGVKVRYQTKVASVSHLDSGKTKVMLHTGEELHADIYIPATGLRPMSDYVPAHLKDPAGYIKTNPSTLRVDGAGPRVYAAGDIGDWSQKTILEILYSTPVLAANLHRDLLAALQGASVEPTGSDRLYTANLKATQLVPVGRSRGVGEIFGWRVPSWFVWLFKGRDYMSSRAGDHITGATWAKEK